MLLVLGWQLLTSALTDCLNPCYNGMLLVRWTYCGIQGSGYRLNPCYNGMLLVLLGRGNSPCGQYSLNPCYNGMLLVRTHERKDFGKIVSS